MPLTAEQLNDFRADLNDPSSAVWTDDELNRLFTRAGDNYNGAVVYAIDQLLMAHSDKWVNYTQNMSREDREAVWKHMQDMRKAWNARYEEDKRAAQTKVLGMRISRKPKSRPYA